MIYIISGTHRPQSNSLQIANIVAEKYNHNRQNVEIIDLKDIRFNELDGSQYSKNQPQFLTEIKAKLNKAQGLVMVVPEYNGSMPGILKHFIDYWTYPETFEYRPVCFIGIGGRFGGLRPVEHLQQVFGYRNAYCFPERVFITNVWEQLKSGKISDPLVNELLDRQCRNFVRFIEALKSQGLDANSHLESQRNM